jgi:hypothetical protein
MAHNSTKYSTRFDIRINISPVHNSSNINNVNKHIVSILQALQQYDPMVQILPWSNMSSKKSFSKDHPPSTIYELNEYLPRIKDIKSGNTWGEMKLEHSTEWEELLNECGQWLSENSHGIYYKELQCEKTFPVGWLLWSFRAIDTRRLSEEIEKAFDIKVSFRFSAISFDRGFIPDDHKIRALHIWAPGGNHFAKTKEIIQEIYSSTSIIFPLDIKMRFVPNSTRIGLERIEKLKKLRRRQSVFLKAIESSNARSWEISLLDTKLDDIPPLRSLLMDVKTNEGTSRLFLSVDNLYKRNDIVVFSYLPRHEEEARSFISTLVPYMINKYSNTRISEFFTVEACERAQECEWDDKANQVISKDDRYVDQLFDDNLDFEDFGEDNEESTTNYTNSVKRIENVFLGEENDSVGTFQSRNTLFPLEEHKAANSTINRSLAGNFADFQSLVSSESTKTFQSKTEQSIMDISLAVKSIQSAMQVMAQTQEILLQKYKNDNENEGDVTNTNLMDMTGLSTTSGQDS